MVFQIPTWLVTMTVPSGEEIEHFRVPETNLDAFLHVLTFNQREFQVELERNPFNIVQEKS